MSSASDRIIRLQRDGLKPDRSWDCRVIRHPNGDLAIHEVYYDKAGNIGSWATDAAQAVDGEDGLDGLIKAIDFTFDAHCRAVTLPVLDVADMPGRHKH